MKTQSSIRSKVALLIGMPILGFFLGRFLSPARGDANFAVQAPERKVDRRLIQSQARTAEIKETIAVRQSKTTKYFSESEKGKLLSQMTALIPFVREGSEQGRQFQAWLEQMRRNPDGTLKEIKSGLKKFGPEMRAERQFLIQFASRLETDETSRMEFLKEQLSRPVPAKSHPQDQEQWRFESSLTFDSLYEVSKKPEVVEPILVSFLNGHPDKYTKEMLVARFALAFPTRRAELLAQLSPKR